MKRKTKDGAPGGPQKQASWDEEDGWWKIVVPTGNGSTIPIHVDDEGQVYDPASKLPLPSAAAPTIPELKPYPWAGTDAAPSPSSKPIFYPGLEPTTAPSGLPGDLPALPPIRIPVDVPVPVYIG